MLIEFRVENHRSLREEQAMTMEAGRLGDSADTRPRSIHGHSTQLLPAAALYGANASGKSNVLSAMAFMRDAVSESHRLWEPNGGVPRMPFAWGTHSQHPSTFEASFVVNTIRYQYGFVVDNERVIEEWLYAWPRGKKQAWYTREGDSFTFGSFLKGPNITIGEVTRPNALYLSVAAQHKHQQLSTIYSWFANIDAISLQHIARLDRRRNLRWLPHYLAFTTRRNGRRAVLQEDARNDARLIYFRQLLKAADTGVSDIRVLVDDTVGDGGARVELLHQANCADAWLDFEQESQGTQTLLTLSVPILDALEFGHLVLIDELEASLHPLLGRTIIELFNDPRTNPQNAQLVFTTHDTNLLGTAVDEPALRRDQIWFTEKDAEGATKLYPLTDYQPRKQENLERGYLQGRYGAIPFVGNFSHLMSS